ncbi:MAG: response regulator [Phycisphaerae bacterium]|nr:response regulator [Phycisphaerae bacterium]
MPLVDKPRVLIVDDEPALRALLADALGPGQYDLMFASNGREAMDLAAANSPDLIVTDLRLGDCTGLDVIDRLRQTRPNIPAVVITGHADPASLDQASSRRVDVLDKPLDLDRLRATVRQELDRHAQADRLMRRVDRLRQLARTINEQRKSLQSQLDESTDELARGYRRLSRQMSVQKTLVAYQQELISARNDDDVFRALFAAFVQQSGPVFGVAMVCDGDAELQLAGRFGVPRPDGQPFCLALTRPVIEDVLVDPKVTQFEATDCIDRFDEKLHRYLPGLTLLVVPLLPNPGQLIGLVTLYRKGEQPFTPDDLALAERIAKPTAIAVLKNE